jgi:hypothetical protein
MKIIIIFTLSIVILFLVPLLPVGIQIPAVLLVAPFFVVAAVRYHTQTNGLFKPRERDYSEDFDDFK